jgi:2-keto-3-deoxy-6-phosphogluconate aldolase
MSENATNIKTVSRDRLTMKLEIPLVAVGGVTIENVSEYLRSGAAAIGVGFSLFGGQAVQEEDWAAVRKTWTGL